MQLARGDRHLTLCFQVHQPRRLKTTSLEAPTPPEGCFDEKLDQEIMERISANCYIPANNLLLRLIEQHPNIKVAFAISGTAIEQMELYAPDALNSFKALAATGSVDFLSVPYHNSLAFLMEGEEFEIQILEHAEKMYEHFDLRPSIFRNTGMIYNDEIGRRISMMGFAGVLTEGNISPRICPQFLYEHRDMNGLKLLLRNPTLSDDIAFRITAPGWNISAETFVSWLEEMPPNEKLVTLCMDYETFGEHHKADSGIFDFLENFLLLMAIQNPYTMSTPTELVMQFKATQPLSIPDYIMTSGSDLNDWVGNDKQRDAFSRITELEAAVKKRSNNALLKQWRNMQSSDHFFYMSDKADGGSCSPYNSSQEAFHHYMMALECLKQNLEREDDINTSDLEKNNETIEAERRNLNAPVWAMSIDPRHGYGN